VSFYTYLWLREDGTPYYVGKGHDRRAFRKGSPPIERVLIQEFPDNASALEAEKFLIAYYGRKDLGTGILRNRTDGGDGLSSEEVKRLWQKPEHRAMMCKANRKPNSGQFKKGAISPRRGGHREDLTLETRTAIAKKVSKSLEGNKRRLGIPHTEAAKRQMRLNAAGGKTTHNRTHASISASAKKSWITRRKNLELSQSNHSL